MQMHFSRKKGIFNFVCIDDAPIILSKNKNIEIIDDHGKKFEATIYDTGCFVGIEIDHKADDSIFLHS